MVYFGNTPVKIEKVANHPSLLKTDSGQFSEKEKNDLKNELNKTKVYLLTTQKSKKKQLLLIQPESRLDTEKLLVNNRHQTFLNRVRTEKASKNFKEGHKIQLDFNLPKLEKNAQGIISAPISKDIDLNKPVRSTKVGKKFSKFGKQYFRANHSYYSTKQKNSKAICPVFFDKLSAEEFLVQTCELSTFEKTTNSKKSIIESYQNHLKWKEASNQEFLKKLTSSQEQLELENQKLNQIETKETESKQNSAFNFFKKRLIQNKIRRLEKSKADQIMKYADEKKYFKKTFKDFDDAFESLKAIAKEKKENKVSKQIGKTKVISVGLGDLISSYSSLPKVNDLKNFEFLFFPETQEEISFMNEKPLVSVFGKKIRLGKKGNNSFRERANVKGKPTTFKNYQKDYFGKL